LHLSLSTIAAAIAIASGHSASRNNDPFSH